MGPVELPEGYVDALVDELSPFGLELAGVSTDGDDITAVLFEADPESFVATCPGRGFEESYGEQWPPHRLSLWLKFDCHGDPIEATFEVFDLFSSAASTDPELRDRLNTLADPADHAVAVGQALSAVLDPPLDGEAYFG